MMFNVIIIIIGYLSSISLSIILIIIYEFIMLSGYLHYFFLYSDRNFKKTAILLK